MIYKLCAAIAGTCMIMIYFYLIIEMLLDSVDYYKNSFHIEALTCFVIAIFGLTLAVAIYGLITGRIVL